MAKVFGIALVLVASFGVYNMVAGTDPVAQCEKNTNYSYDTCFSLYNR